MSIAIRYYTKSGNTKKLADEISAVTGVEAKTVAEPLEENVDILFLGSSVYAAGVDASVEQFIKDNRSKIGTIVNFSTAALLPSTFKQIKKIAGEYSVEVCEKEFHCKGSFGAMHKNRPNAEDLKAVSEFAKSIVR